jgi:hypothetical protein
MRHEGNKAATADGNPPPLSHGLVAPKPCEAGSPRNAVFVSFLRLFAANHHKSLSINNLQQESSISD